MKTTLITLTTLIVIIASIFLIGMINIPVPNSSGQHSVYITAVDGGFFTSSFYVKTSLESSQEETYCVQNNQPEIIDKLKKAQVDNQRVLITYSDVFTFNIFRCGTVIQTVSNN